jgi:hypothetical protein
MPTKHIEEAIRETLYQILDKHHKDEGDVYHQLRAKADDLTDILHDIHIEEEIESSEGQGTPKPSSLMPRLKPSLDEHVLRLLMLMSNGDEKAIKELAELLILTRNPALTKALTKAMEKGYSGAELVLRKVVHEADGPAREAILRHVKGASEDVENRLRRPPLTPQMRPIPK